MIDIPEHTVRLQRLIETSLSNGVDKTDLSFELLLEAFKLAGQFEEAKAAAFATDTLNRINALRIEAKLRQARAAGVSADKLREAFETEHLSEGIRHYIAPDIFD